MVVSGQFIYFVVSDTTTIVFVNDTILLLIAIMIITACSPQVEAAAVNDAQSQSTTGDDHADDDHEDEADDHATDGDHADETDDHDSNMTHAHVAAPAEFADLTNPFAGDHEAIEAGEVTYNNLCATCHGAEGKGDGPGAAGLDPKPATLADGMMMNSLSDGYLFWRVSKGGMMEPFNSAMIAWDGALTEEQRWEVISYVRTLAGDDAGQMGDDHTEDGEDHDN